jgi:hypothetical protein
MPAQNSSQNRGSSKEVGKQATERSPIARRKHRHDRRAGHRLGFSLAQSVRRRFGHHLGECFVLTRRVRRDLTLGFRFALGLPLAFELELRIEFALEFELAFKLTLPEGGCSKTAERAAGRSKDRGAHLRGDHLRHFLQDRRNLLEHVAEKLLALKLAFAEKPSDDVSQEVLSLKFTFPLELRLGHHLAFAEKPSDDVSQEALSLKFTFPLELRLKFSFLHAGPSG